MRKVADPEYRKRENEKSLQSKHNNTDTASGEKQLCCQKKKKKRK